MPDKARILLVDDDPSLLKVLAIRLQRQGYDVRTAESGKKALAALPGFKPHVVITDMRMDGMDGLALFDAIRAREPTLPVIVLTAHGTIPDAVDATQRGVFAYLTKPFERGQLVEIVERALRMFGESSEEPFEDAEWSKEIITRSSAMKTLLREAWMVAQSDASVLIRGESGTGKELLARAIHKASRRKDKPLVAVNCTAIPEQLFEAELFGHEKGAFTGAIAQRKGLFELANHGTLFLDEIGEMPLATQTKLLRVLESREFMRVGGETPIRVDVRVIAATNTDLRHAVELGEFRRDLYYRLNVLHIELPPLRERRADIPLLIDRFMRIASREHDRPRPIISPEAMRLLMEYDWPGNIRELRNLIESMVVLSGGQVIRPEDIPVEIRTNASRPRVTLPVPAHAPRREPGSGPTPELEFVFRTLLQLRVDLEDLRREFEEFRRAHPELPGPVPLPYPYPYVPPAVAAPRAIEEAEFHPAGDGDEARDEGREDGVVVFRPGMTMSDLEREAITAALREVRGNRRKAAQMLGIGERTLYRKIKEYGIPL